MIGGVSLLTAIARSPGAFRVRVLAQTAKKTLGSVAAAQAILLTAATGEAPHAAGCS